MWHPHKCPSGTSHSECSLPATPPHPVPQGWESHFIQRRRRETATPTLSHSLPHQDPPPAPAFGAHSLPPTGPGHCHLMGDLSQNLLQVFASTIVHRGPLRSSGLPRHSPVLSLHLQKHQCQHFRTADKTLLRPCHAYNPFPLTRYCRHTACLSSRVLNNPSLRLSSA